MNLPPELRSELTDLLGRLRDGELDKAQSARLNALIGNNPAARRFYLDYIDLCASLHWARRESGAGGETGDAERGFGDAEFGDLEISGLEVRDSGLGIRGSGFGVGEWGFGVGEFHDPNLQISKSPNQQIPSLSTLHSPLSTNFVGGPVFSYIAATLILGVMMLGAWAYKISHGYDPSLTHNSPNAKNSRGSTTPGFSTPQRPEPIFVARITGMKDCRWADPQTETYAGAAVPLGRKYALSSGLMEITYRSGAKVILEGPCSYQVESSAGGFLALGKLTARVEKSSEVGGRRSDAGGLADSAASMMPQPSNLPSPNGRGVGGEGNGNQKQSALTLTLSQRERGPDSSPKPQDLRPKTEISKSPNLQIAKYLFAVRTPTALVTDLGTEFGVEVAANGDTTSHVFQGRVVVRTEGRGERGEGRGTGSNKSEIRNQKSEIVLLAGQSARVEKDVASGGTGKASGTLRIVTGEMLVAPPRFVRRLSNPPDAQAEESYIKSVLEDRPLGYWPLSEPANARYFRDRSGNGFHGAAIGTVLAGRPGPLPGHSRAVELNGDGYIDIGRQDRFALENNFTVEAWVWIDPDPGDLTVTEPGPIISAGSGEPRYQQSGWHLSCRPRSQLEAGGESRQRICTLGSYDVGSMPIFDAPMPVAQWAHAAFVFNPDNTARAYVDGRASAILTGCKPPKIGPAWIGIGWHSNRGGEYWRGRLAHVAVYDRALDERQILNHYRIHALKPVEGKEEH